MNRDGGAYSLPMTYDRILVTRSSATSRDHMPDETSQLGIDFAFWLCNMTVIIICPIAIAYSMGQIIKSFCVCPCVCVCVSICGNSHGRISSSIFTKLDTDV